LVGAHEHEGNKTTIFWGNNTGVYLESKKTILPSVNNYGVILDFDAEDLDGDGDRDLVINRTGGGNSNFYIGRRSQLLINNGNRSFTDKTSQIDNPGVDNETWFPWIRIQDADNDGDLDILSDDLADEFFLKNDGSAKFTRI
ncbi:MAG TPA: FG-GAP-like repeat-containing protein, partial [Daejeonella sp.]|nr:FG-GAP-like repeat-containing protein [Daejeonella sp.]